MTRDLLRLITTPPSRHRLFLLRTFWTHHEEQFTARNFVLMAYKGNTGALTEPLIAADGRFSDFITAH